MVDKNEMLKAASKLKNAKKRKTGDVDENSKGVKKSTGTDKDNGELAGKIVNAVKHLKGDD